MLEHWREQPPVDVLAAAWLGFKPPPRSGADGRPRLQLMAQAPTDTIASLRASGMTGALRQQ